MVLTIIYIFNIILISFKTILLTQISIKKYWEKIYVYVMNIYVQYICWINFHISEMFQTVVVQKNLNRFICKTFP